MLSFCPANAGINANERLISSPDELFTLVVVVYNDSLQELSKFLTLFFWIAEAKSQHVVI